MEKKTNKILGRLATVSSYAIFQFSSILGQFLMSYLVIKYHSESLWGEVVEHLLIVNLATLFFTWGQNTYLIRSISSDPSKIGLLWQESLLTRSILLILTLVFIAIFYSHDSQLFPQIALWLVLNYLYYSIDPIHLFTKTFKIPIFIETLSLISLLLLFGYYKNSLTSFLIIQFYIILFSIKTIVTLFFYRKILFKTYYWHFNKNFFRAALPFFLPAFIGFIQSRMDLYGIAYYLSEKTLGAYQVFFGIMMLFILGSKIIINPFLKIVYRLPFHSLLKLNRLFFIGASIGLIPCFSAIYVILPFMYNIYFEIEIYITTYSMVLALWSYIIFTHILIRYKKENQLVGVFFIGAIFNMLGNYFFIPNYGVLGAVGVMAVVQWGMWVAFYILVKTLVQNDLAPSQIQELQDF